MSWILWLLGSFFGGFILATWLEERRKESATVACDKDNDEIVIRLSDYDLEVDGRFLIIQRRFEPSYIRIANRLKMLDGQEE